MRGVRRRLNKLERLLTDGHGLIPYSETWLAYWRDWLDRWISEPDFRPTEKIPFEAARILIRSWPETETVELADNV